MTMEHIAQHFKVTLHVQHPTIDPEEVTTALQLNPLRSNQAGPPRKPPFDAACWVYEFDTQGAKEFGTVLENIATQFAPQRDFFHRLVEQDGVVKLSCSIFAAGNWDEILDYSLMGRLADLSIDLRLDVYPNP